MAEIDDVLNILRRTPPENPIPPSWQWAQGNQQALAATHEQPKYHPEWPPERLDAAGRVLDTLAMHIPSTVMSIPGVLKGLREGVENAYVGHPTSTYGEKDPELAQEAANAMMLGGGARLFGGRVAVTGPELGTFGGRMSRTADLEALKRAQDLDTAGTPREDIIKQTGWFRDPTGAWMYEIPDAAAHASIAGRAGIMEGKTQRAGDVLWHPQLYAAYPEFRNMKIDTNIPPESGGVSRGGSIGIGQFGHGHEPEYRSVLLHEMQHEIARPEDFMVGTSPEGFGRNVSPAQLEGLQRERKYFEDAQWLLDHIKWSQKIGDKELAEMPVEQFQDALSHAGERFRLSFGTPPETGGVTHELRRPIDRASTIGWINASLQKYAQDIDAARLNRAEAFDKYWRQASEVTARNVERRKDLTMQQRREQPPWTTERIPSMNQIIDYLRR